MNHLISPDFGFAGLTDQLGQGGWTLASGAGAPLVPGEPEHAVFERGNDRLVYTFNPVCRLRVIDASQAAGAQALPPLPFVDAGTVRKWLASDDERSVLRGILAASVMRDGALADAVDAHRQHPRASIASAAARSAELLRDAPSEAQAGAMAMIEVLKAQLTPLLMALGQDADGRLAATLQPRPGDYALAFQPGVADRARQAYHTTWSTPPRGSPASVESRLVCHIATAGMLGHENALSRHFPGGYRAIAHLLQPQRAWVAWKLIEPGRSSGMAYDGLVWLDDHWAWFPRPYRMLAPLPAPPH
jgi:hypothetical protein